MRRLIIIITSGLLLAGSLWADEKSVETMADDANAFAVDLYSQLAEKKGNLFFSPTSIHTALAMTYAGACGETAEQMAKTMHYTTTSSCDAFFKAYGRFLQSLQPSTDAKHRLDIANALWLAKAEEFLSPFLAINRDYFKAGLFQVNFRKQPDSSRKQINDWVEEQTQGKIQDLLPPKSIDSRTRMVLTNAVYFKALWVKPFKQRSTRDRPFHLPGGESINVSTMHQTDHFAYMEDETVQALKMDYRGGEVSMLFVLPKKRDGVSGVEDALSTATIDRWVDHLKRRRVDVFLPKVEMHYRVTLAKILKQMGMAIAFSSQADFSGMTGAKDLFISQVFHKAYVAIDEKGTEAAAATAVTMRLTALPPQQEPVVFRADHPYLVLLRHEPSGAILFMGRVSHPQE